MREPTDFNLDRELIFMIKLFSFHWISLSSSLYCYSLKFPVRRKTYIPLDVISFINTKQFVNYAYSPKIQCNEWFHNVYLFLLSDWKASSCFHRTYREIDGMNIYYSSICTVRVIWLIIMFKWKCIHFHWFVHRWRCNATRINPKEW